VTTVDDALAEVDRRAAGRTRYEGQPDFLDEVLAHEVRQLREQLCDSELRYQAKNALVIRRTMQLDAVLKALDRADAPARKKLAERFRTEDEAALPLQE
jgi:hypothetical protein